MQYKLGVNNEIKISEDRKVIYTISPQHRSRRQYKSKWSIRMYQEVNLFIDALNEYEDRYTAWNLKVDSDKNVCVIGKSADGHELKIAKFIDSDKKE